MYNARKRPERVFFVCEILLLIGAAPPLRNRGGYGLDVWGHRLWLGDIENESGSIATLAADDDFAMCDEPMILKPDDDVPGVIKVSRDFATGKSVVVLHRGRAELIARVTT